MNKTSNSDVIDEIRLISFKVSTINYDQKKKQGPYTVTNQASHDHKK